MIGSASRTRVAGIVLAAAGLAAGCRSPGPRWPFPRVRALGDSVVYHTLRERSAPPRTLYAVLAMSFESEERSAVLTAVVRFERPGKLRMTAYKDLLISSRDVFDLVVLESQFVMRIEAEDKIERDQGSLEDLARRHPGFRALAALREAVFLPGLAVERPHLRSVRREPGAILVEAPVPSGATVEWVLDNDTLGVREGRLRFGADDAVVIYSSYIEIGGRFFPEAFELRDPGAGVTVRGALEDLEVDPPPGEGDFELEE